uniref:tRNA-binding domain-containing protein n=1 Tax=Cuerna arida TaxID=1464854 RepID=A0A1B6H161_9HEMI
MTYIVVAVVFASVLKTSLLNYVKQLMSLVLEKHTGNKIKELQDENNKIQNEINAVKKELIQLQVANGVPQIPVPGDKLDVEERPVKLSAEDSGKVVSTENTSNESKPVKAAKSKKQVTPAAEESPIDVGRLDIRVGKVLHAQVHPDADQLYIEQIDVGEEISRTVVSGLVRHIPLAELDQRMVLVLCNLKPQKMRGIVSEAMVLCASTPETVELLTPPLEAKAGDNITVPGYPRNPDLPFMNPKKKIFEKVAEDLKVNSKKQASYKDVPWEIEGKPGYITVQALSGCHIR